MSDDLKNIYESILAERVEGKRREITGATADILDKASPKSTMVLDYASEILGLDPEELKRLPIKALQMLKQALTNLIIATKKDPMLRQSLRKRINAAFSAPEEVLQLPADAVTESVETAEFTETYREFLATLSEASKASKFNYKMLLDLEPNKLQNPFFVQLLTTFGMGEDLTRPQKQGVLLFLKKLAEIADVNPQVAQMLTKLVRIENITNAEAAAPVAEGMEKKKLILLLTEASSTTVAALPVTLGIDSQNPGALNKLAGVIGETSPTMNMAWKDLVAKFGSMTFYDFLQKADISIDSLASKLVKVFPKVNPTTVKNLG